MPNENEFELRSQSQHEIMQRIPAWYIRMGSGLMLITTLLLLAGANFISYPDLFRAESIIEQHTTDQSLEAVFYIPQKKYGEMKTGTPVELLFYSYPAEGVMEGKIVQVEGPVVEKDNQFKVIVELPKGNQTAQGVQIPVKVGLQAESLVILQEKTLIQRLFNFY